MILFAFVMVNQRNFQIKQMWGSIIDERIFSKQYSKNRDVWFTTYETYKPQVGKKLDF